MVLAGGLTKCNTWTSSNKKFFIPVKVLAKKFRGKYLFYLKQAYRKNQLKFYKDEVKYQDPKAFKELLDKCYTKDWYTYTKRTFQGPLAVIKYLGRYTHRIAISNSRIISIDNDTVTIAAKDYKSKKKKTVTMQGIEFIRRFLMHVLPKGFVKIRYYGILANRNKNTKLALCRKLTGSSIYKPKFKGLKAVDILYLLTGKNVMLCPMCKKGKLFMVRALLPEAVP